MRASHLIESRTEWIEPEPIPPASGWGALDRDPLVAAILYRRGVRTPDEAQAFLDPANQPPPDPDRIPNMAAAVDRIRRAIATGEGVGIFGDYDVDGVTSAAILTQALQVAMGADRVVTRLPERAEGYGLNDQAIRSFHAGGVSLVIAVDCGSTDHDHAAMITGLGMDLVVFDHHHMPDRGPEGAITVSPQLNGDGTYHDLTAAGVVYLLVRALATAGVPVTRDTSNNPAIYLDLAALGTVADVAPLAGVNRQIVAGGVVAIREGGRPGIAAVASCAGLDPAHISAEDIAFALAPRLNAAGRIGTPRLAFDLLMTDSATDARRLSYELEQLNIRRKSRSNQVRAEAHKLITARPRWQSEPVVAVQHDGWEAGLVGAVASRLADELRRPVLLFRSDNGMLTGSARSVEGFNLVESLGEAAALLSRYGGHSLAAGLTLPEANLDELVQLLSAALLATGTEIPAPRRLMIDARLPADHLHADAVRQVERLEPFGRGNERPLMLLRGAELRQYSVIGTDRSHLKLVVKLGGRQVEAVHWGAAARSRELVGARSIDLVGRLELNRWNGSERLQLKLDDFRTT